MCKKYIRKSIAVSIFYLLTIPGLSAQDHNRWGVSTNALTDLFLLSPNIRADYYFGVQSVVSAGGSYGWWGQDWNKSLQQWHVSLEYNHYLKKDRSYTGHRFGLGLTTGQYERRKDDDGRKGHYASVALLYGYTWSLKGNWYLDAGLGVGYLYRFYHRFKYHDTPDYHAYCCTSHSTRHRFAPTGANVSFIYRF